MSNNTTIYTKKLVKIVYEKERQIEQLKRQIKSKVGNQIADKQNFQADQVLRKELTQTTSHLKGLSHQMDAMETKISTLYQDLSEEETKSHNYEERISQLMQENCNKSKLVQKQSTEIDDLRVINQQLVKVKEMAIEQMEIFKARAEKNENQSIYQSQQNKMLKKQLQSLKDVIKEKEDALFVLIQQNKSSLQKELLMKRQSQKMEKQLKEIQQSHNQKLEEIEQLRLKDNSFSKDLDKMNNKLEQKEKILMMTSTIIDQILVNHKFEGQNFQQINQYSSCGEVFLFKLRSIEAKLEQYKNMVSKAHHNEEINQTLQGLSMIVRSVEDKLQLCGLSSRLIAQEQIQMENNEDMLLQNLEKECNQTNRTKIIQLEQTRQMLQEIKLVNYQLMDEVIEKDKVINTCRNILKEVEGKSKDSKSRILTEMIGNALGIYQSK